MGVLQLVNLGMEGVSTLAHRSMPALPPKQLEASYSTLASFRQARLGACQDPTVSVFQKFPYFAFPEPYIINYFRQLICQVINAFEN